MFANSGEPDQTPHFVASDLVLHCLPMSHEKDDSRLIRLSTHAKNEHSLDSVLLSAVVKISFTFSVT